MGQFLAPETDRHVQFLAPEIVNMGQKNFWSQKLTKWFSFWGQKPYFMGEWNFMKRGHYPVVCVLRSEFGLILCY